MIYVGAIRKVLSANVRDEDSLGDYAKQLGFKAYERNGIIYVLDPYTGKWVRTPFTVQDFEVNTTKV